MEYLPAIGRLGEQSAVRSIDLGGVRLTYVVDGAMGLRPEVFFPDVPAGHWRSDVLDPRGRVAMSVGGLLVERDDRALLVDAGLGATTGPLGMGETVVGDAESGELPAMLDAVGVSPADVDTVAFTHLHTDHTGWAIGPGRRPFFPNARYVVAADEWAPHAEGVAVPGAPSRPDVLEPLGGLHTPVADGEEIFPGVHALVTPGHTAGHTSYVITTPFGRLVAFGDAFHIPGQVAEPGWPSLPDVDHDGVLAARNRVLAELEQPGTLGFACHFGDQVFGRVIRGVDGERCWEPVPAVPLFAPPRRLPG